MPVDDLSPDDIDLRFGSLVSGLDVDMPSHADVDQGRRLAIVAERLDADDMVLVGSRARYLMTSFEAGRLAAYGWRTDLRVCSDVIPQVDGLRQAGIQLIDEREHYLGGDAGVVTVEVSRVWVERLMEVCDGDIPTTGDADWLRSVVTDPNQPIIEPLHSVARRHHLIGARVVHAREDGDYVTDLRAVSPALMGSQGTLMVPVVAESSWYRWGERDYDARYRPVRAIPAAELWVE
ncbi:hypothetical protein DN585_17505 [Intrasporangium calvum]|nr:hypothetical protein DN585_17505 [Intrasporangium calvum]